MLGNLKIYFSEDSELVELETEQKEWRGDILISINNELYMLEFITINRLTQEYLQSQKDERIYSINEKTILITKLDKKTIINTIVNLTKLNFFKNCIPVNLQEKYKSVFKELQKIESWVQVY